MGCACSAPGVGHRADAARTASQKSLYSFQSLNCGLRLSGKMFKRSCRKNAECEKMDNALSVPDVLAIAKEVVREDFQGIVSAEALASIALIESGGLTDATKWEEHLGESRHGLCQMLFSTARYLSVMGHKRYSITKPKSLHTPHVALYFGAAYIQHLSNLNGEKRDEECVIRGYFGGFKTSCDQSTDEAWVKYVRAREQISMLEKAMQEGEEGGDEPTIHVVQAGESLQQIAQVCSTSLEAILEANPDIRDADLVQPGDCIEIPVKVLLPRLYVVRCGDSMASIARRHDVSLYRLLKANPEIRNQSDIKAGWVLSIPGLAGSTCDTHNAHIGHVGLISAGIESGSSFLNAMAERYGLAIDDGFLRGREGLGVLNCEDLRGRLQGVRKAPALRIPGRKLPT